MNYYERDKFFTKALGYKIHDDNEVYPADEPRLFAPLDFSCWEGFGKLWEWAQQQEWWLGFVYVASDDWSKLSVELIHPDRFADAVYTYLHEKELNHEDSTNN
jgi:hypothetical protein